jgi:hypothetical protein
MKNFALARFGLMMSKDAVYPAELMIPPYQDVAAAGAKAFKVAVPKEIKYPAVE